MEEFLVFRTAEQAETSSQNQVPQSSLGLSSDGSSFLWTRENTLLLLELYKKYRLHVGTLEIRNFKKLWEKISNIFKETYGVNVAAAHCENRWRVLERNFKKWIDNKNQTGAGRKFFEYAEEMNQIIGKKKNINPSVILSTSTIAKKPEVNQEQNHEGKTSETGIEEQENVNSETFPSTENRKRKIQFIRTTCKTKKKK